MAEIAARLADEKQVSLGVVALCAGQRDIIQDKLDALLLEQPELAAKSRRLSQPVLVKYAGHWQGQTRDTILLSVTFGPDKSGRLPAYWGPLGNRDGWGLLCVALTRASRELVVYSSLDPGQIDLAGTQAEGVAALCDFLQYAAYGESALALRPLRSREHTGALEQAIDRFVRSLGYKTRRDVGVSGFRVDIGVLHPKAPDRYMLAIICDGKGAGVGVKDRLLLQDTMLRLKGWNLHRVWTLDWLGNTEKEMEKIRAALDWALENSGKEKENPLPAISFEAYEREEIAPEPLPEPEEITCVHQPEPESESEPEEDTCAHQPEPESEQSSPAQPMQESEPEQSEVEPEQLPAPEQAELEPRQSEEAGQVPLSEQAAEEDDPPTHEQELEPVQEPPSEQPEPGQPEQTGEDAQDCAHPEQKGE